MKNLKLGQFIGLIGAGVLIDQISKFIVMKYFPELVHLNTGIAFSLPIGRLITVGMSLFTILAVLYFIKRGIFERNIIWAIFVGGGIGNLIDRISTGKVVDFIQIGSFPVFNIADILLSVSAILIIYFYILTYKENESGN